LVGLIEKLLLLFVILIFVRVILSFVIPLAGGRPHPVLISANALVNQITEPVLGPIRRSLPRFGGFDFSPLVVLIVISVIREAI